MAPGDGYRVSTLGMVNCAILVQNFCAFYQLICHKPEIFILVTATEC